MSLPLLILDEAEDELKEASARYEAQAASLGADFRFEVDQALHLVSSLPRSGRFVPGLPPDVDVRRVFVKRFPFSVIYLLEPTVIWVVAFAHHRRRPGYWRRRLP